MVVSPQDILEAGTTLEYWKVKIKDDKLGSMKVAIYMCAHYLDIGMARYDKFG